MATESKKIVVSKEHKLEAIRRLDKGVTMQRIADDFGIGRVIVGDWEKNDQK